MDIGGSIPERYDKKHVCKDFESSRLKFLRIFGSRKTNVNQPHSKKKLATKSVERIASPQRLNHVYNKLGT